MRRELNEAAEIDRYLAGRLEPELVGDFETRLLLDQEFADKVEAQRQTLQLIRMAGRQRLRIQLGHIYRELMQDRSFAQHLQNIF